MKIAVIKEKVEGEWRVAATPETVSKMVGLGLVVYVQEGAGRTSGIEDNAYKLAGAKLTKKASTALKQADMVLKVQPPSPGQLKFCKEGAILVGLFAGDKPLVKRCAQHKYTVFALEYIPRITRAQAMDVLSSQSNLAGYKAVIDAVAAFGKVVPMMMTAAGRIDPARVLVLGAGVAGLQAIATAKRLGAIVSAFDVRPAAQEQVESLGAKFIKVDAEEGKQAETAGGYAKEMSKDYQKQQEMLIHETIKTQDIVIATALIPGKPAPLLVTEAMVKEMKPGAVIVDLAVASGGNCALSKKDEIVLTHGVQILGYSNMPSRVATDASRLYARNILHFITPFVQQKLKKIKIDFEDEIIQKSLLTHDGKLVHPSLTE